MSGDLVAFLLEVDGEGQVAVRCGLCHNMLPGYPLSVQGAITRVDRHRETCTARPKGVAA
jgi:hypothetical protein